MNYTGILFLYFFLPLFFGLYAVAGAKRRAVIMSLGSCAVAAWAQPLGLIPLGVSVFIGYCYGRLTVRLAEHSRALGCLLALAALTETAQAVVFCTLYRGSSGLFTAFGCGIYSLHTVSYCFDVFRGEAPADKNLFRVFAYIGFVPSLCGIPAVRYKTVSGQFSAPKIKSDMLADGILLLLLGIAEKLIISDRLTELFYEMKLTSSGDISFIMAWLGAFLFACSVYSKLKGYANIARGFGMMLGFDIGPSFTFPMGKLTLRDYIYSFNVSAASFVREYLYRTVCGRDSKRILTMIASSLSITLLCLSYCPSLRFLLWGLSAALFILLEIVFEDKLSRIPKPIHYLITHMLILLGWAFVSQSTVSLSLEYISNMFAGVMTIDFAPLQYFLFSAMPYVLLLVLLEVKPLHDYYKKLDSSEFSIVTAFKPFTTLVLLLLCTVFLMSGAASYTTVGIGGA